VIMLAQAVRIERTWASFRATLGYQQPTPEEIWRAGKESNPARRGFGDQPAPSAQPEMADDRPLEDHTLADTTRFPAGSSALAGLSSKMAETAGVEPARPGKAITGFRPDKHAVACLHEMAEGGVVETHAREGITCFRGRGR